MTHTASNPYPGLPDPDTAPEFYTDVPTKRLLAWFVDTAVIVGISLLIVPFTAFTALFFFPFLVLVVSLIYRIATLSSRSATWGMRLFSIEFRTHRGERFDGGMAALHTIAYSISISMVLVQLVSIILMLTNARGQGLSDLLLGTAAINKPARS